MTPPPIPLAKPVLGPEEEARVLEVLRSGRLSLGPRLEEFEAAFAGWLGAGHASAVSSGTAGLHLALRAVGVVDGDEVITTPFSFVASVSTFPSARFSTIARHDSSRNSGSYSPVSLRSSSSNEPSAASKW